MSKTKLCISPALALITILLFVIFSGCSGAAQDDTAAIYEPCANNILDAPESESADDPPPAEPPDETQNEPAEAAPNEPANRIPTIEEQIPSLERSVPFVMPQANCDLEDELLDFMHSWWREFLFPQFSDVSEMQLESWESWRFNFNESLALMVEWREYNGLWVTSLENINAVGRSFFGSAFNFPLTAWGPGYIQIEEECYLKSPLGGRGGIPTVRYLLVSSLAEGDAITATFLPYVPLFSWEDSTLLQVWFLYRHIDPVSGIEVIWELSEVSYLEVPEGCEVLHGYEGNVLDYVRLRVPQETLGTLTVTFTREDGRLIAVSSVLNDNH